MIIILFFIIFSVFSTNNVNSLAKKSIVITNTPTLIVEANVFIEKNLIKVTYDYYKYNQSLDLSMVIFAYASTSFENNNDVFIRVGTNYVYFFDEDFNLYKSERVCLENDIPTFFDPLEKRKIKESDLKTYKQELMNLTNTYEQKNKRYYKKLLRKIIKTNKFLSNLKTIE